MACRDFRCGPFTDKSKSSRFNGYLGYSALSCSRWSWSQSAHWSGAPEMQKSAAPLEGTLLWLNTIRLNVVKANAYKRSRRRASANYLSERFERMTAQNAGPHRKPRHKYAFMRPPFHGQHTRLEFPTAFVSTLASEPLSRAASLFTMMS
jgi:hypothetical protein